MENNSCNLKQLSKVLLGFGIGTSSFYLLKNIDGSASAIFYHLSYAAGMAYGFATCFKMIRDNRDRGLENMINKEERKV